MKNILKIIFLSIFVFLCTGCATIDYTLSINKDNSATLEYLINIEETEINIDIYSGIIDSIILDLEANEFVVERTTNQVKATKQISNILELDELDSLIKANDMYIIKSEKGIFATDYIFDANIDLTGYSKTAKELKLDKELKELLDIKFNLNLPVKSSDSNLGIGQTKNLTWNLAYGQENVIKAGYSLINAEIVIIPILTIIIFAIILIVIKVIKSKKETIKF
ncbi:MAG: hypothetical protein E7314_04170 [Clostridiales bacterium]|nr:hypothetical protein [Clostridiales bacterium]